MTSTAVGRFRPACVLLLAWLAASAASEAHHDAEQEPLVALVANRFLRRGARTDRILAAPRLDAAQLSGIRSVSCLKARQLYPKFDCRGSEEVPPAMLKALAQHQYTDESWGLGNYPSWRDPACRSGGRLLCDPGKILEDLDRRRVAMALDRLTASASVRCGELDSRMTGDDLGERRPFRLGVAIASGEGFSREGVDPATLQKFGLFVLANWDLMPTYNGVEVSTSGLKKYQVQANCPDAALLVVLPEFKRAFLSSPSCEFLCAERGGPEVIAAVENALADGQPLADAIAAGTQAVGSVLNGTVPMSVVEPPLTRKWREINERRAWLEHTLRSSNFWITAQRVAFVGLLGVSLFVLVSFLYFNCGPQAPVLRKAAG